MKTRLSYWLLIFCLMFASCDKDTLQTTTGDTSMRISNGAITANIPFASVDELSQFSGDPSVNDYNVARKVALLELNLSFNESMGWHATHLSEKPVIVYDYDSKPKFYEFIVTLSSGSPVGTVTVFAKRQTNSSVAYTLPFVRNYNEVTTKGNGYKMFVGKYPSTYLGIPSKSGDDPSTLLDASGNVVKDIPLIDEAQEAISRVDQLSAPELSAMGIEDRALLTEQILEENRKAVEEANYYWGVIDTLEKELLTLTDEEISEKMNDAKGFYNTYYEYIIPTFNQDKLKRTRWKGWCGPSALAWVYRGYFSSYKGYNLPLHGDSNFPLNVTDRVMSTQYSYYNFDGTGDYKYSWYAPQSAKIDGGLYRDLAYNCDIENGVGWGLFAGASTPGNMIKAVNNVEVKFTHHLF